MGNKKNPDGFVGMIVVGNGDYFPRLAASMAAAREKYTRPLTT
ncbi:MAG: hypothetical protein AAB560_02200 [Patescibacteria group bacterium]